VTGSGWGGILQSRSTKELAEEFRKNLADKIVGEESAEALQLLYGIREELLKELSAGRRIPEQIGALVEELTKIRVADELKSFMEKFLQLATELYHTRASVSSTFTLAQSFYDRLITVAFEHALKLLETGDKLAPSLTYAVLVSGELGRVESSLGSRSRFFFIYSQTREVDKEQINELAMSFMAVLSLCFPAVNRNLNSSSTFWFGSDALWSETAGKLLKIDGADNWEKTGGKSFLLSLETVADMRIICGDPEFGQSVLETGRKLLDDCIQGEPFWHLAKDIASMPVALGIFGRFKTMRSGKNRGKFDLKGMAIDPLAAAVRILSLTKNRCETSFTGRIKSILEAGDMGVSLGDRLLIAYQDFMRERIRLELAGAKGADGLFFDPDELDEESRERFKAGLEDVTTLQRLVHQQLVEV
jgi:signal-transduction protein with cAMP-binding, CBS, and nucleotidyltransferase domain